MCWHSPFCAAQVPKLPHPFVLRGASQARVPEFGLDVHVDVDGLLDV